MTQAVIKTGGKQYVVSPGNKIKIEKVNIEQGKEIVFNDVLLFHDGKDVKIGKPFLSDVKVKGKVLSQDRHNKVIIFKYKPKKRYRLKKGHRQPFSEVEITKIDH